ncbi:MAG: hypothetical protein JAY75_15015 [Candidatus Thiodiazotropha taylori]|nr:hypothetical protein [Candidatus Thiodiazotropha taylori]MCW4225448.1 hypothetical protein [Candidatus Thiodiazotropha endolucinida]MCG7952688.1 hypothetical protein [Candidatus Thiodiazotropha taylori]MCG8077534.1 hypothetical protein [Candidatus Thiodiazotropha taylori]MCW4268113.1 hypothetical protein [Candidatus Thiodiazotropha endolucinida]
MTKDDKRTFWQQHIQAHKEGDQSQRAYCAEHGLSKSQFSYWKSQFDPKPQVSGFVPVRIQASAMVRIDLPGGIGVSVPTEALASLLPMILRCATERG